MKQSGYTLIEILISTLIAGLILLGLQSLIQGLYPAQSGQSDQTNKQRQASFAMQRMLDSVRYTRRLLLPLADNPATDWREDWRQQTVPASPPEGSSTAASAVLAMTLSPLQDLDEDGWADANNDQDYQDSNGNGSRDTGEAERIDEDTGDDMNKDNQPGLAGIDDDGDGDIDESSDKNDDESGGSDDDPIDGIDNDGDGSIDEDANWDMNDDNEPGIQNIDDDGDGNVDEGEKADDDEDGQEDEDHYDSKVFYLSGDQLIERIPVFYDANGDSSINGEDTVITVLANEVSRFSVEYNTDSDQPIVIIELELGQGGDKISVQGRARPGSGL